MADRRADIEAFVRGLVREIECVEATGKTGPEAIAAHFNAKGITTRKGRRWTTAAAAKFMGSAGARRYRSAEEGGSHDESEA